jgi:hypothetical protein
MHINKHAKSEPYLSIQIPSDNHKLVLSQKSEKVPETK